jgi:hypothetical protein
MANSLNSFIMLMLFFFLLVAVFGFGLFGCGWKSGRAGNRRHFRPGGMGRNCQRRQRGGGGF